MTVEASKFHSPVPTAVGAIVVFLLGALSHPANWASAPAAVAVVTGHELEASSLALDDQGLPPPSVKCPTAAPGTTTTHDAPDVVVVQAPLVVSFTVTLVSAGWGASSCCARWRRAASEARKRVPLCEARIQVQ